MTGDWVVEVGASLYIAVVVSKTSRSTENKDVVLVAKLAFETAILALVVTSSFELASARSIYNSKYAIFCISSKRLTVDFKVNERIRDLRACF